jgi:hypothetical protein
VLAFHSKGVKEIILIEISRRIDIFNDLPQKRRKDDNLALDRMLLFGFLNYSMKTVPSCA